MQKRQNEWYYQWRYLSDDSLFLFKEWIYPNTLENFKNKNVLDCGCGSGQHINFISPYADKIVGVDLNTSDIATMNLNEEFVGVIHHTDDPEKSFNNIVKHVKKGGKIIIWIYSFEGNYLNRTLVEFLKRIFFLKIPKKILQVFAYIITFLLYFPIYSFYLLPLRKLPFYLYFRNWRKLNFYRNFLNVFDKLNAPQTFFIKKTTVEKWFDKNVFKNIHISSYNGVSWRASGIKI
ncbi:MAG: hypothetical protein ACD_79C00431G0003 [uncultured bacterium]|nr:MAG: hypothetical protein ACD_79C00431G0003 [uncultured bacterium]